MVLFHALWQGCHLSAACYSCASAVRANKQMEIGNSGSARRQSDQFFACAWAARAKIRRLAGFVGFVD